MNMNFHAVARYGARCLSGTLLVVSAVASAADRPSLQHLLDEQRYRQAAPVMKALLAKPQPTEPERQLIYDWLFAINDIASLERRIGAGDNAHRAAADLVAMGRLALSRKNFGDSDQFYAAGLDRANTAEQRALALRGLGLLAYERRDYEGALRRLQEARQLDASPAVLASLGDTLIRLGRTNEAVDAFEQAVRKNRYHEAANYQLGNGYARANYTELAGRCKAGFERAARATRRASDAFDQGRIDDARRAAELALRSCPGYGRAHAVLAKVAEAERIAVDVHHDLDEQRFAATPMPEIPQIERYVANWDSLSQRHRKRVALSVAPWKAYVPVLVAGGSTLYIKPLYMRLSQTPGSGALRDARIDYDSRLWDDVRGAGGHLTVTGIEDVERAIFGRYNTVLHELSHQVHGIMTVEQKREIQELYRQAKERDAQTGQAFLSRYAGGSIWEYFAEGANSQASPRRDAYDFEEIRRERLAAMDPALQALVLRYFALSEEEARASLPTALVNSGLHHFEHGDLKQGLDVLTRALALAPADEQVQSANLYGLALRGASAEIKALADRAQALHPDSGLLRVAAVDALWHGGASLAELVDDMERGRHGLRADDLHAVDLAIGTHALHLGRTALAHSAFDRALAYQGDSPEALWGRAAALALSRSWDEAFSLYDRAVKLRTGSVTLRLDLARDLLLAGRLDAARMQIMEIKTLSPKEPQLLALIAWMDLLDQRPTAALASSEAALELGPWCDTAQIVRIAALRALGRSEEAETSRTALERRLAANGAPRYIFRKDVSAWESVQRNSEALRRVFGAVAPPASGS